MTNVESSPSQHRIYLGPPLEGLGLEAIQQHWIERHSEIVKSMPHLQGYVQNRPVAASLVDPDFAVCAETWFESRADERAAYASDYYRDVIEPDEKTNLIERSTSWNASVVRTEPLNELDRSGFRLLVFGASKESLDSLSGHGRVEVLHLHGPGPFGVEPFVLSAWFTLEEDANRSSDLFDLPRITCRSVAVVSPPAGWP